MSGLLLRIAPLLGIDAAGDDCLFSYLLFEIIGFVAKDHRGGNQIESDCINNLKEFCIAHIKVPTGHFGLEIIAPGYNLGLGAVLFFQRIDLVLFHILAACESVYCVFKLDQGRDLPAGKLSKPQVTPQGVEMLAVCERGFAQLDIALVRARAAAPDPVDFARDIQPLLSEHCASCHGGVKKKGGLSLVTRSHAFAETDSGAPAIVPGDTAKSELVARITTPDEDDRMPPEKPLSADQVGAALDGCLGSVLAATGRPV